MNGARPLGPLSGLSSFGKRPTILISGLGQIQDKTAHPMDQSAGKTEWPKPNGIRFLATAAEIMQDRSTDRLVLSPQTCEVNN
jgi:hypothetical protein